MVYAATAISIGRVVSGSRAFLRPLAIAAAALALAASLLLLGPSAEALLLMPDESFSRSNKVAATLAMFPLFAMALSVVIVLGQSSVVEAAINHDPELSTTGSGLGNVCASIGAMVGSAAGGHIIDEVGFVGAIARVALVLMGTAAAYVVCMLAATLRR